MKTRTPLNLIKITKEEIATGELLKKSGLLEIAKLSFTEEKISEKKWNKAIKKLLKFHKNYHKKHSIN